MNSAGSPAPTHPEHCLWPIMISTCHTHARFDVMALQHQLASLMAYQKHDSADVCAHMCVQMGGGPLGHNSMNTCWANWQCEGCYWTARSLRCLHTRSSACLAYHSTRDIVLNPIQCSGCLLLCMNSCTFQTATSCKHQWQHKRACDRHTMPTWTCLGSNC
jgi:hypothetical protein